MPKLRKTFPQFKLKLNNKIVLFVPSYDFVRIYLKWRFVYYFIITDLVFFVVVYLYWLIIVHLMWYQHNGFFAVALTRFRSNRVSLYLYHFVILIRFSVEGKIIHSNDISGKLNTQIYQDSANLMSNLIWWCEDTYY